MMTSISELVREDSLNLAVEICAGCDTRFAAFVPVDPGDHFYQVVTTYLCDKCTEQSNQGLIKIHMYSELDEVDAHRKENGLVSFNEAYEKFKLDNFNSYLKSEGKLIKHYEHEIGNGTLSKKLLMWMIEEVDKTEIIDINASTEQLEKQLEHLLYGPEEEYSSESGAFQENYYDPHRDLMIERYKELGSSYFS